MAINQIFPFGTAAGANVLAPADYQALASRNAGFGRHRQVQRTEYRLAPGVLRGRHARPVHRRQERPGRAGQRRPGRAAGQVRGRPGRLAGLHWHAHRAHARRRRQERQARHHRFRGRQLPRVCSIGALPTQDIGPIIVAECSEVWTWVSTQYYTGYRSPLCGRPVDGHTVTPLASEVDAVGGELSKTDYARLWGMRARIIWWCPMRSGPRTVGALLRGCQRDDVPGAGFAEYVPAVYGD